MEITFLIGNGFDIRMGLKSRFRDVEENYIHLPSSDEDIKSFKEKMRSDIDNWSDFELAMGKIMGDYEESKKAIYRKQLDDFTREMIKYLSAQEDQIDFDLCDEEIKTEFSKAIINKFEKLSLIRKRTIENILLAHDDCRINFISFNYTHILDKCISRTFQKNAYVGNHLNRNGIKIPHNIVRKIVHIHGELPDSVILGVDNIDQMNNSSWKKDKRFCQRFVKPMINKRKGSLADDETQRIIQNSKIIFAFGMSLGATDRTWWALIAEWLLKNPDNRLIICSRNKKEDDLLLNSDEFDIEDDVIDKFINVSGVSKDNIEKIENKIYTIIDSDMFSLNLVELTKKKKNKPDDDIAFSKEEYDKVMAVST
ncbi:MAG: AbiH family protein [Eubacteriales bacterium]|nr:AbiH family protein [Eubacteriales bacterium]